MLADGREIAADVVIAGIGAAPRTGLAAQAGLAIDNGIACNTYLQTSDPEIFAVGDCCSFPHPVFDNERLRLEAWRNASDQAIVAVENMLGGQRQFEAVPWFWSDQFELTLQIAGLPHRGVSTVKRIPKEDAFILCHLNAEGRLVGASGIGQGNADCPRHPPARNADWKESHSRQGIACRSLISIEIPAQSLRTQQ